MSTQDPRGASSSTNFFLDDDDIQPILFELAGLCERGAAAHHQIESARLELRIVNERIGQITVRLRTGEKIGSVSDLTKQGIKVLQIFASDPSHDFTLMELFKIVHPDKARMDGKSNSSEYNTLRATLLTLSTAGRIHKLAKGRYRWAMGWV